jgi:acid stress chaperone HdeB
LNPRSAFVYDKGAGTDGRNLLLLRFHFPGAIIMKIMSATLFAAFLALSSAPAHAVVLDLSTMTRKQFIEGGDDEIKMVLTWMDGWYKGDEDEAIIDTEVFVANAKKFGTFCAANPSISIVNAAEKILGK